LAHPLPISGGDDGFAPFFDDPMFRRFFGGGPQNRFGKQREELERY
jgi:hypothetical protein